MLASGSCLLTDVVDQLHEDSKKINVVDCLSRQLNNGTPTENVYKKGYHVRFIHLILCNLCYT